MDAHFDQVTQLRAELARRQAPARRYFAYSTVLDRAAFETWRSEHGYGAFELQGGVLAEAPDVDLVYDFPSRWWGGRVAGWTPAAARGFFTVGARSPIVMHKEGATGWVERPPWSPASG
jgi:hypothetical protein